MGIVFYDILLMLISAFTPISDLRYEVTDFSVCRVSKLLDPTSITLEEFRKAQETIGNPESEQYDEEAFCQIMQKALDAGILEEADRMRAEYRLEVASKNRRGEIASDFRFLLRGADKKNMNLHGLATDKPILLLFYDPDCDHCLQTITSLKNSEIPTYADIVAIYAEDDRERWSETADDLPEGWTVGFAIDPIQDDETYVFLTSPVIYLLDSDKRVILKDTTLPTVMKTLESMQ